jgi:hypothetical protein
MNFWIWTGTYFTLAFGPFLFYGMSRERVIQKNLTRFIKNPSEIAKVIRDSHDDEGYIYLYVITVGGEKRCVASHTNVSSAERLLYLAMRSLDSVPA